MIYEGLIFRSEKPDHNPGVKDFDNKSETTGKNKTKQNKKY